MQAESTNLYSVVSLNIQDLAERISKSYNIDQFGTLLPYKKGETEAQTRLTARLNKPLDQLRKESLDIHTVIDLLKAYYKKNPLLIFVNTRALGPGMLGDS